MKSTTKRRIVPHNGTIEEFYTQHLSNYMDRESFEMSVIKSTYHEDTIPIEVGTYHLRNIFNDMKLFNNHK